MQYKPMWYILVGRKPVPCRDTLKASKWFQTADRVVKKTTTQEGVEVSTVFLGLDHSFSDNGPPVLFETMVFRNGEGDECLRCCTWDQAEAQHMRVCKELLGLKVVNGGRA